MVVPRLARYVLREASGLYLLGIAGLCLLLSIDFLTVLARFLVEQGASVGAVGATAGVQAPWFLHLTLPIAVVFACCSRRAAGQGRRTARCLRRRGAAAGAALAARRGRRAGVRRRGREQRLARARR
jgi:hypothetical protein